MRSPILRCALALLPGLGVAMLAAATGCGDKVEQHVTINTSAPPSTLPSPAALAAGAPPVPPGPLFRHSQARPARF